MNFPKPLLDLVGLLICGAPARAQKAPDIGYVFPPGGKAGTTA